MGGRCTVEAGVGVGVGFRLGRMGRTAGSARKGMVDARKEECCRSIPCSEFSLRAALRWLLYVGRA